MFAEHRKLWATLESIWADKYPKKRPRSFTLIEKLVTSVVIVLRMLSLSNFCRLATSDRTRHILMDVYVLFFAALATAAIAAPVFGRPLIVAAIVYRLLDIVCYRVYFLLVKSEERPWEAATLRRSLIVVLVNVYEVVVGYGALYRLVGSLKDLVNGASSEPMRAMYFSVITTMTIGYGDVVPGDDLTRGLVILQTGTNLILLIFIVPALISVFSSKPEYTDQTRER